MACSFASCVPQNPVLVGDHDSMDELALSLLTEVTCTRDGSTMVEEHSGVLDSSLLITVDPKLS